MSFNPDEYWRSKDFKSSARLYLQHWLFQSTLGYVLQPSISLDKKESIRVADLGCGNGAWLVDLSKELPSTAQLHGFDILPKQFPAPAFLPPNITLENRDVLQPIPNELVGVFDIVHARALGTLIRNNETGPLLNAVRTLLTPGGFLQWEEMPQDTIIAQPPSSAISVASTQALLHVIIEGGKASGNGLEWYSELDIKVQSAGFDSVQVIRTPLKPEHYKAWTEDYLLVWEDVAYLLPSKADAPEAPLNREQYQGLFGKVVEETSNGVVAHCQKLATVTARKPL